MRNVITIMKKEFARFFLDRRLLITSLILPGVLIFISYSFIGGAMISVQSVSENYKPVSYTVNMPDSVKNAVSVTGGEFGQETTEPQKIIQGIKEKRYDALVVFPKDFDALVSAYNAAGGLPAPNVEIYYNSASKTSNEAYKLLLTALDNYKYDAFNKFDVNKGETEWDLSENKGSEYISGILPMLIVIFLFSGCLTIAPESIAGEKERGTIATLLVTPIKKSELAAGKILSLGVMALLCGLSTGAGLVLSFVWALGTVSADINMAFYGARDLLALLAVVLSTVVVDVAFISILSAYSKSVKEAATLSTPLIFVNMLLCGLAISSGAKFGIYSYIIPGYNSVLCLTGIFGYDYTAMEVAVTTVSNILLSCAGGFLLAKMFDSERIIFNS